MSLQQVGFAFSDPEISSNMSVYAFSDPKISSNTASELRYDSTQAAGGSGAETEGGGKEFWTFVFFEDDTASKLLLGLLASGHLKDVRVTCAQRNRAQSQLREPCIGAFQSVRRRSSPSSRSPGHLHPVAAAQPLSSPATTSACQAAQTAALRI